MAYGVTTMARDVVDEGDESCSHQMEPDHWYDLPDPDPRNPIRVKTCERCDREIHLTSGAFTVSTIAEGYKQ